VTAFNFDHIINTMYLLFDLVLKIQILLMFLKAKT